MICEPTINVDGNEIEIEVECNQPDNCLVEIEIISQDVVIEDLCETSSEDCVVEIQIETQDVVIEADKSYVVNEECVDLEVDTGEVELEIETQIRVGPEGPQGPIGPQGVPGLPGPGGTFEIVPITITSVNTWTPVPKAVVVNVSDVEVFDQLNMEKVIIDIRVITGNIVEIRSKSLKTFNVHIMGA